ncbi:MAG TPA: sugar phosphate nucleotidyltransferase [Candidatus Binatia bacterium]
MKSIHPQHRCGIVFTGGKGGSLRPFIHYLKGSTLPKPYVNFIGTRSMIEHTLDRAERLIRRECLMTVVTRDHLSHPEVQRQLANRRWETVVVQPDDRDTGPAILLSLLHLRKRCPGSTVAVFPSDHFIVEEELFMSQVAMAFYLVESNPASLVLLGIEPEPPETDYPYILTNGEAEDLAPSGARNVRLLAEQPRAALAGAVAAHAGLWNTMTMVFNLDAIFELIRRFSPELYASFQSVEKALGTRAERAAVEETYRRLKPASFSREVLERSALLNPGQVYVLPVAGVFWSDWGSEPRILNSLKKTGYLNRLQKTADGRLPLG